MATLKSTTDLSVRSFFNKHDNDYRINKLIKLNEILSKEDYDIELDDLRFLKLNKYKSYSLVKAKISDLQKILPNYCFSEPILLQYLPFLGINQTQEKDIYSIQLDVYIDKFIRINLKEITFEENLSVICKLLQMDGRGFIKKENFNTLIRIFHDTSSLCFEKNILDMIVEMSFNNITKNSNEISKTDLTSYLTQFKEEDITINPFTKIKSSIPVTKLRNRESIHNKDIDVNVLERIKRKKQRSPLKKFWFLNKKILIWIGIYLVMCLICGIINRSLENGRQYGTTLAARFFAGIIFFNLFLLILFICNTFTTLLSGFNLLRTYLPLGDPKTYHIFCGIALGVTIIPHVLLHLAGDYREIAALTSKKPKDAYVTVAWLTFANWTGLFGVFCLIFFTVLIIVPLVKPLINKHYEIFMYTHKVFFIAIICLAIHANTPDTKRKPFIFFMSLPLFIYFIELLIRLYRYFRLKSKILHLKTLPSGVVLLELQKPDGFSFKCGQYCQINIPILNKYQWHPFTIASSPVDNNLYFYISPVGDWTKSLQKLGEDQGRTKVTGTDERLLNENDYIVRIEGPLGAPAEHYSSYENVIFVAGGVGATPFSSILIGLLYKMKRGEDLKHKSITFYWIQREYEKTDFLSNVLEQLAVENKQGTFEINIFITCGQQRYDFRSLFLAEGIKSAKESSKGRSISSMCCANVYWGRPEWDSLFLNKTLKLRKKDIQTIVGVFICGNDSLVNDVYEVCENYSSAALRYELNTENF